MKLRAVSIEQRATPVAHGSPLTRFNFCDQLSVFITQSRGIQKIGPVMQRLFKSRSPPPAPDVIVIAVQ
jgi:hypothetical protein